MELVFQFNVRLESFNAIVFAIADLRNAIVFAIAGLHKHGQITFAEFTDLTLIDDVSTMSKDNVFLTSSILKVIYIL
jgi:hypothetical protein